MTLTGTASVRVTPDIATVTGGIATEARSVVAALGPNAQAVADMAGAVQALGLGAGDVRTAQFQIEPLARDGGRRGRGAAGYRVVNRMAVTVRDLTRVGAVVDALLSNGANLFDGVAFGLADESASLASAREGAVANARRKAETLSAAAGLSLGRVVRIEESGVRVSPGAAEGAAAGEAKAEPAAAQARESQPPEAGAPRVADPVAASGRLSQARTPAQLRAQERLQGAGSQEADLPRATLQGATSQGATSQASDPVPVRDRGRRTRAEAPRIPEALSPGAPSEPAAAAVGVQTVTASVTITWALLPR